MRACAVILLLGAALPVGAAPEKPKVPPARTVPVDEIRRFTQVFEAVRESYVDALTDEEIMRAGLRGLLLDIDPHSSYLSMPASASRAMSAIRPASA